MMARRPDEALDLGVAAEQRRVVGRRRAAARRATPRRRARGRPARARRRRAAARRGRRRSRSCRSRAPPSSRRGRSGRPRAGRGSRLRSGRSGASRPGPCGSRRRRIWPLTGRSEIGAAGLRSRRSTRPRRRRRARPATTPSPATCTPVILAPSEMDPLDGLPRTQINPNAAARLSEGGHRRAGVGCVVARNGQRKTDRRRERGLEPARSCSPRDAPLRGRARVAGRARARALPPRRGRARRRAPRIRRSPGSMPGRFAQLRGERWPRLRAAQPELEQRELAGVRLGDGREHARRDVRRAASELAALEHPNDMPALRRAPRDGEPDDAPADDDDVRCCGWVLRHCTSLRRHDPDQLLTVGVTPSQPALRGLP